MEPGFRDPKVAEQFQQEGYAVVPFLNEEELARAQRLFAESTSGCQSGFYSTLWSGNLEYRKRVHDEIEDIFSRPAQQLLSDYRMCLANFAVKHAQKPDSKVPIHQDWSMVDENKYFAVAFWCPLVDVDSTNGCLAVVPRTHRLVRNVRCNHRHDTSYSPYYPLFGRLEESYLREIPMKAGETVVYQQGLLHGSKMNQSEKDRAAIVAVFLPREAHLKHFYQTSESAIDEYDVEDDFYWRSVELATPPKDQRLVRTFAPTWNEVTEEQVAALLEMQPAVR